MPRSASGTWPGLHSMAIKLPEVPSRIARLPRDPRGYPVPWFVEWIDGKPDFRVMDARKLKLALREPRCWICGGQLGTYKAFNFGPISAVNGLSGEPPSHRECAIFAAQACPFLSHPKMRRNERNL